MSAVLLKGDDGRPLLEEPCWAALIVSTACCTCAAGIGWCAWVIPAKK
ncbi:MAG: hypothetical protein U0797_04490 [Gemmataceae bacterium]